jgi:N-acetyl-gamma-glutamyl-phosphate reductase
MQNMNRIKAGIIGAAGYTGGELIRLLLWHPDVALSYAHSRSNALQPLHAVHTDLLGDTEMTFAETWHTEIDVLFLCLGHGESRLFLENNEIPRHIRIIDLSQDFRLGETIGDRVFVYGLPELNRSAIQSADNIANPGCFATAIQLGLLPLNSEGLLNGEIHTTGITGSTGAGQKWQATTQHSWRNNNVNAYKTLTHQHLKEIKHALNIGGNHSFIPWRGDFTRGIFVTSYLESGLNIKQAVDLYKNYYSTHPFTHISDRMIDLKQVVNTNKALLHLEQENGRLVIHSAEDNLLKGASGQAVQNMNLMFGLDEHAGLRLKSVAF